jgi:hypothetical protein
MMGDEGWGMGEGRRREKAEERKRKRESGRESSDGWTKYKMGGGGGFDERSV